ncbi:transcription factor IIIB 90 kDa subunit-like isoform X2 [Trifolium pratense]|uniref:transcription factor IIIB 90 kDa subunit-like isoform X2 n=1 Tax=Trifolium pratense TaxID=57577 RepID=UPI001E697EA9|nr:transcription factor IIIB 90 kDa subunit-like isoform X2 [Trifolium pratense]
MVEVLNTMASEFKASTSNDMLCECEDESESFSDIDDQEIDQYLFNDEEKRIMKIFWEYQNREYLEEEAAKEAEKKLYEAIWINTREDLPESMERYESALEVLARYRERRPQQATYQMVRREREAQQREAQEAAYEMSLQRLFEDNPAILS